MLETLIPNWGRFGDRLISDTMATLQMVAIAGSIAFILGMTFGVLLVVTKKEGILEQLFIYNLLDMIINVIRSIPFLILLILLIPISRAIVGTGLGVTGAIIPLVFGTTPFFARQIESAIAELDSGLVEASLAMGMSPIEIIFSVYLRESIPSITRVTQITAINLVALTTFAGAVGAGGLGDFAIQFGLQLRLMDLLWAAIIIILIIVSVIQGIGNVIIKWSTK
ncbi:MAG: ABC transporter permease subunit [Defluviitaleaceae bacterium]|nr:ABC transporter permease subunit [Defluviitaleaceae bacterium]